MERGLVGAAVVLAIAVGVALWAPWVDEEKAQPPQQAAVPDGSAPLLSRPDLRPPKVTVETHPDEVDEQYVFISPRLENVPRDGAQRQQGAVVFDSNGRVVWFRAAPDGEPTTDFRVQRYQGEPVLTWWEGAANKYGEGRGQGVIVDRNYKTIATVQAGNDEFVDLHEFLLTDRGTALVTIYSRAERDLTAFGGKRDGTVTQGIVQEIDVESGEVLFEWESLDHVELAESHWPQPSKDQPSWDYFHINSVDEDEEGDLLLSARHTDAIYKIDRETGEVEWRLGGKRSDFDMGPGTEFGLQHDARFLGDGVIGLFDNAQRAKEGERQAASSAKRLRLDEEAMTATLEEKFDQPNRMWAETQGSAGWHQDGGAIVGWGSLGAFTRFAGDGSVVLDGHIAPNYDSYRAYLARWDGQPETQPAVDVRREGGQIAVAASWNGATAVRSWQVLAGSSPDSLLVLGRPAPWNGLETTTVRATPHPYVAVAALDAAGKELARSRVVEVGPPPAPGA